MWCTVHHISDKIADQRIGWECPGRNILSGAFPTMKSGICNPVRAFGSDPLLGYEGGRTIKVRPMGTNGQSYSKNDAHFLLLRFVRRAQEVFIIEMPY